MQSMTFAFWLLCQRASWLQANLNLYIQADHRNTLALPSLCYVVLALWPVAAVLLFISKQYVTTAKECMYCVAVDTHPDAMQARCHLPRQYKHTRDTADCAALLAGQLWLTAA